MPRSGPRSNPCLIVSQAAMLAVGLLSGCGGGSESPPDANVPREVASEPLFRDQWHLRNTGQKGLNGVAGKSGEDVHVLGAWPLATGKDVRIAIVDESVDLAHEDLRVVPGGSFDYLQGGYGTPDLTGSSGHGTAVAGIAAARAGNGVGGVGVAYDASVVGLNVLAHPTDAHVVDALRRDGDANAIYNNSWGVPTLGFLIPEPQAVTDAVEAGLQQGRGGRGSIYVWAAGNDGASTRTSYSGQLNFRGAVVVGALDDKGKLAPYSIPGPNLLVTAYGGSFCDPTILPGAQHPVTTADHMGAAGANNGESALSTEEPYNDLAGQPNYTRCMNGTSAAAPQVSAVVALMLQANPGLGWRDVRAILAHTARRSDPTDPDWRVNGAGMYVSDRYGYGAVDAKAAVDAARRWTPLPAEKTVQAGPVAGRPIPGNGAWVTSTLTVAPGGATAVEYAQARVTIDYPDFAELQIQLVSPAGTVRDLAIPHECVFDESGVCGNLLQDGFSFGVSQLIDEQVAGTWQLRVRNTGSGRTGELKQWSLKVWAH